MSSPATPVLARAVLSLERGRATGSLRVHGPEGRATLAFKGGRVLSIQLEAGEGRPLGDYLMDEGSYCEERHRAALASSDHHRFPVGRWLTEHGVVTAGAVAWGLRKQLRERFIVIHRWQGCRLRFSRHGPPGAGATWKLGETPSDLVLRALRADAGRLKPVVGGSRKPEGKPLALTALGEQLRRATCTPAEAAVLDRLADGGDVPRTPFVDALESIGAVRLGGTDDHGLLLRKRAAMRRGVSGADLLDLQRGASPTEARRSLRRLAARLHPDRFMEAGPGIQSASREVLRALIAAEQSLSKGRAGP